MKRQLILASGSVYRLQLLEEQGYAVQAVASGVAEPDLSGTADLGAGLIYLAHLKARAVAEKGHQGIILAADTLSHVNGQLLGKPESREAARRMLQLLSGNKHMVLTGWCFLRTSDGLSFSGVESTSIEMRRWSDQEVEAYLDSGEWEGKCGAYGLQWPNDPFVTALDGSPSNVIGLPLETLDRVWTEFMTDSI